MFDSTVCSGIFLLPSIALSKLIARVRWAFCFSAALLTLLAVETPKPAPAQTNEWAWMGGSNTVSQKGIYGSIGIPAVENVPGARQEAVSWADKYGNLWLFGGWGNDAAGSNGFLNDLWKYSPSTGMWTWVSGDNTIPVSCGGVCTQVGEYGALGQPSSANTPGGREGAMGWTDNNGNLWLFGGYSFDMGGNYGKFNDLWEFNPTTSEWTWVGGKAGFPAKGGTSGIYGTLGQPSPTSQPGSRMNALAWTDSGGNFWLFGGAGFDSEGDSGSLNDLWEFNPSTTGQWTWMGGSNFEGQPGVYGTLGVAAAGNIPGARGGAVGWIDNLGNLWLSGGGGIDANGIGGDLDDLWEYNPSTAQWTWEGGSGTIPYNSAKQEPAGTPGVYGELGVPAETNFPGSRTNAVSWSDEAGNFWLLGGQGFGTADSGDYNDLWIFNPVDNEWAWMGGSSTTAGTSSGQVGKYGTLGTPAATNVPGGRYSAASWIDKNGNLWLFGGYGYGSTNYPSFLNDLWEYAPAPPSFPASFILSANSPSLTVITSGAGGNGRTTISSSVAGGFDSTIVLVASGVPSGATVTFSPASITGAGSTTLTVDADASAALGTYPVTITGTSGNIQKSVTLSVVITGPIPTASPSFSPAAGTYTMAQSITLSDATPGATIYYTTDGTIPTINSTLYSGPINVSSTETILAIAVSAQAPASSIALATYTIEADPSLGEWSWMGGSIDLGSYGSFQSYQYPSTAYVPAARSESTTWTDKNGNFWLFGGFFTNSLIGAFNDLWEFNPSTNEWAWMSGSPSVPSCPNAAQCLAQPGVYGTLGTPDLGNHPGGRTGAAGWTDSSGNLWLFGGYGATSNNANGYPNDMWEFSPTTKEWTWMGGSNTEGYSFYSIVGNAGVYGTLGVPAPGNIPGGRTGAATWTDKNGNLWLFGGYGEDAVGDLVLLNDLWEFTPPKNEWTWWGGTSIVEVLSGWTAGVYGTEGVPAAGNIPGSRTQAAAWTDSSGNFWLMGGNAGGAGGFFNDLWEYNPSTNQWAWMNGAKNGYCPVDPSSGIAYCSAQPAVFGSFGVPAAGNTPAGASGSATWTDQSGNFWLFGAGYTNPFGQEEGDA